MLRTARRRLAAASAACALALGAFVAPAAAGVAAEDLKDRREQVQREIRSADRHLDETSERLRRATQQLDAAVAELAVARAELQAVRVRLQEARDHDAEMQARLDRAVARLEQARADLARGRSALEVQRVQVTDTVTSIYAQGDPQLMAFASLLTAETPADLTVRMQAQDVIVGRETSAYDDLHAAEVLLQVQEEEVEAATEEVAVQREAAAEHLALMRDLRDRTAAAEASVRGLVETRRDARAAASSALARDEAELAELRQREEAIRERILAQVRRAQARAASNVGAVGAVGARPSTGGFLMTPVAGPVTSPFGYRDHPIYHYWGLHDGTDFGVGCGQPLWASGDGTVMSRYYSSSYGNRLYLNLGIVNGQNVTVVYNHLSGYAVGPGERVSRGEVVGYVGNTGWSTGCHLHFTVLVNGTAVDPMNWL